MRRSHAPPALATRSGLVRAAGQQYAVDVQVDDAHDNVAIGPDPVEELPRP